MPTRWLHLRLRRQQRARHQVADTVALICASGMRSPINPNCAATKRLNTKQEVGSAAPHHRCVSKSRCSQTLSPTHPNGMRQSTDVRYVVTSLDGDAERLYEGVYCQRAPNLRQAAVERLPKFASRLRRRMALRLSALQFIPGNPMPVYRRTYRPGGCWFFTVNLADRRKQTLVENIAVLMSAIRLVKRQRPFRLNTLVVLPDHLHTIWELPDGDTDFPGRWRAIKKRFSRAMPAIENRSPVQVARSERNIWQRRYWEHLIRDEDEYRGYVDYCYYNPVKHGLVAAVRDWPHSTYHRDVRAGIYSKDFDIRLDCKGVFGEHKNDL